MSQTNVTSKTSFSNGLSADEAVQRLKRDGFNELPARERRSFVQTLVGFIREPMILLLISSASLYFFIGEISDALILSFSVVIVISLTVYQERKTENALAALKQLSSPRARVIRDNQIVRIPGREVVRDDVLILAEGDRVPADGVVIDSDHLSVNESLLTGESAPVRKRADPNLRNMAAPGGEDQAFVYSGTLVTQGQAHVRVLATGRSTQLGQIGHLLSERELNRTKLQNEIDALVKKVAVLALIFCAALTLVYGLALDNWVNGILSGLTLSLSLLPEEFPTVLTVFLALGAWRLSRHNVLTRHVPAIEALGTITVLCTDKTGTLTENKMRLRHLSVCENNIDLSEKTGDLLESHRVILRYSVLASLKNPFDPMETAIQEAGQTFLSETKFPDLKWLRTYPLSHELFAMTQVWTSGPDDHAIVAAKGSPEAIAKLCRLSADHLSRLQSDVEEMAMRGLRVLGVAKAMSSSNHLPERQEDFHFEYLGLIGFEDPLRGDVPQAVAECKTAGIRVVMITGDHPETARAIGRQAGLVETDVFARITPVKKLNLVEDLQNAGEIVAMTGDGVNDAPALKTAHVGIAMGKRGTDVAREAAALVLLDDHFSSIVSAIRMGRRIYDNLQKAIYYLLAVHIPIAGIAIFPIFFGWPTILMPIHIVFLELIIDPVCSVVFELEEEEKDIMNRPPRSPQAKLLTGKSAFLSFAQGAGILFGMICIAFYSIRKGDASQETRSLTFTTLIIANFFLILVNRSRQRSLWVTLKHSKPTFWAITLSAFGFLGLALFLKPLMNLFHFAPLHGTDYLLSALVGFVSVVWVRVKR